MVRRQLKAATPSPKAEHQPNLTSLLRMRLRPWQIVSLCVCGFVFVATVALYWFAPQTLGLFGVSSERGRLLQSFFPYRAVPTAVPPLLGVGDPPPPRESFLTGLPVKSPEDERFLAVMVDEAPQARPHFRGVDQAGVLFEMPAEGGIPRIMAIISDQTAPEEIGPVRSTRDYFVDIAEGIAGGIVHAGGSPQALAMLRLSTLVNIDENARDPRFRRDLQIARPHNLFLQSTAAFAEVSRPTLKSSLFPYREELPAATAGVSATRVDVDFSLRRHAVTWQYDATKKCYQRIQEIETMSFCPQNVIVASTAISLIAGDEKGRLAVKTTGSGPATLFRDGRAYEANWQRVSKGRFRLIDSTGQAIPLKPGQTFFQIVDSPQKLAFVGPPSPAPNAP